jgi:MoaA/NifB/PqqE/SkfB family radical SAM enzyme
MINMFQGQPTNEINKVVKGMALYFSNVENIKLGSSDIDFLLLNVPPICNYRCKKCFTRAGRRKIKNPLSRDEWFSLIQEGKKLGVKNVSILGEGEPLIQKNIKEIIGYIDMLGMTPMIATNALALDPTMADFLFQHNTTVGFSLDTLNENEYNQFCGGKANFSLVMKNIQYARKLFAQDIQTRHGYRIYRFLLHMTVTPKNFYRLNELREFCGEDIFFDCQPLANVGVAEENASFFGQEMTYNQFQMHGHRLCPPMVLSQTETRKDICCLFYYGLAIDYSGDVMFDTHAIQPQKYIGNIRDLSLKTLLERAKKIKKYFLERYHSGYCPVRDASYHKFIDFLRHEKSDFFWPSGKQVGAKEYEKNR